MRPIVAKVTGQTGSATSIAASTTLGAAGNIPQGGTLATAVGIAAAQTSTGTTPLLLNGSKAFSGTVLLATPTRLNLQSTGNLSAINFTIVGEVAQGPDTTGNTSGPQTEVIAGPNNNIVTTLNTFIRVLSITPSASVGTNVVVYGTAILANATEVALASASDNSAVTFKVSGFNANGQPITESITGPGAGLTVNTVNYFSAVTQIAASAATTAVTVGNSASASTPWVVLDYLQTNFNVGLSVELAAGDSTNYSVEITNDDVFGGIPYVTPTPVAFFVPVMALVGQNINGVGSLTVPCRAVRVITNSGTGVVTLGVTQGMTV